MTHLGVTHFQTNFQVIFKGKLNQAEHAFPWKLNNSANIHNELLLIQLICEYYQFQCAYVFSYLL